MINSMIIVTMKITNESNVSNKERAK